MHKIGWIMTALFVLFIAVASAAPKLLGAQVAADAMVQIGWTADYLFLIGVIELGSMILFVVPRTALLGAVLFTGLLGGALAANLNAGSPLFSHTLFSIYMGVFMWLALWLRDAEVRHLFPLKGL